MLILAAELYIASAAKNGLYICHVKQILTCYAFVMQLAYGPFKAHKISNLMLTKRLQELSWARLKPPQKRLNGSVLLP
jgi:hypothetical protein